MRDYIVTLLSADDLAGFYADMENSGGNSYIPQRAVPVVDRRPISRNTEYNLSSDEASALLGDPRVLAVEPKIPDDLITITPYWTQTGNFDKAIAASSDDLNWGLLRCANQATIAGWEPANPSLNRTIECTASGRNVDIVICDGFINVDHPQVLDGGGQTRVIQLDWGAFRSEVEGEPDFEYTYPTGNDLDAGDNNHGMHVGGTASGLSQGWARDANVYNISPYQSSPNPIGGTTCYDYIRHWHNNKPLNFSTGIRNPTIVNNSWGGGLRVDFNDIVEINEQGNVIQPPYTFDQLSDLGLNPFFGTVSFQLWTTAEEADTIDAINDGVIMVAAAGNDAQTIAAPGDANYNNTITFTINGNQFTLPYLRGSVNGSAAGSILVGATGTTDDTMAIYSNRGTRIDVWAPGSNIISSVNGDEGGALTTVPDPLDNTFLLSKLDGTSMASPQVCGILACWLEQNPRATPADCLRYLQEQSSRANQVPEGGNGGFSDVTDLMGSTRNHLCFDFLRPSSITPSSRNVVAYPHLKYGARPETGALLPRSNRLTPGFFPLEFDPNDFQIGPVEPGRPTVGTEKEYHIDFSGLDDPPVEYTWTTTNAQDVVIPNGGGFNGVLENNNVLITFANSGPQTITATAIREGYDDLEVTLNVDVRAAGTEFALTSSDFNNGAAMPQDVGWAIAGGNFDQIRNPALAWANAPAGTQSFSLLCLNSEAAPDTLWDVSDIPNTTTQITSQTRDTASNWPAGVVIGDNYWVGTPDEDRFSCENGWGAAADVADNLVYTFSLTAFDNNNQILETVTLQGTYLGFG